MCKYSKCTYNMQFYFYFLLLLSVLGYLLKLHLTGNGFAKAGILQLKSSIKTTPSKNHFRFFKITKNKKTKWFFATESAKIFNARELHPRFCKTDVICRRFFHSSNAIDVQIPKLLF